MPDWTPEISEVLGVFRRASNTTLLALTTNGEKVIYKPTAGQRPLWDFEAATLAVREWLAFEVSKFLAAGVVPETTLGTGPMGPGSIQRYVEPDPTADPLDLVESTDHRLWPIAVLDIVTNNADRKLGHLLADEEGRIWAIDHGLTFHRQDKLRTVLWGFARRPIPTVLQGALGQLEEALIGELGALVAESLGRVASEVTLARVRALLADPVHPDPPLDRPPLPWPIH